MCSEPVTVADRLAKQVQKNFVVDIFRNPLTVLCDEIDGVFWILLRYDIVLQRHSISIDLFAVVLHVVFQWWRQSGEIALWLRRLCRADLLYAAVQTVLYLQYL